MQKMPPEAATLEIHRTRYSEASTVFLCGSVVRKEDTQHSDLDLVVLYEHVEMARRESYVYEMWPVEAFIHDPQTLEYFFLEVDRSTGIPSLADMVASGIALPAETDISRSMRELSKSVLAMGPPQWNAEDLAASRYTITDLIDDVRSPRSREELIGAVTRLYPIVADHFFRSQGLWSAKGKSIPRRLQKVDPVFAEEFVSAFQHVLEHGMPEPVIRLCERLLEPTGGWLFSGYALHAPAKWRMS
jgi:hypothetical protein